MTSGLPTNLRKEIKERIRLGIYSSEKEVIHTALRKAFSQEARDYLRNVVTELKVTKKDMLKEWGKVRG